jgi:hypothetical protein
MVLGQRYSSHTVISLLVAQLYLTRGIANCLLQATTVISTEGKVDVVHNQVDKLQGQASWIQVN